MPRAWPWITKIQSKWLTHKLNEKRKTVIIAYSDQYLNYQKKKKDQYLA